MSLDIQKLKRNNTQKGSWHGVVWLSFYYWQTWREITSWFSHWVHSMRVKWDESKKKKTQWGKKADYSSYFEVNCAKFPELFCPKWLLFDVTDMATRSVSNRVLFGGKQSSERFSFVWINKQTIRDYTSSNWKVIRKPNSCMDSANYFRPKEKESTTVKVSIISTIAKKLTTPR